MRRVFVALIFVCIWGMCANAFAALTCRYMTNAIYDVYGAHQQVQKDSTTPFSTVISNDGNVYSQVHHTANQLAVESNIDGWAYGHAYYDFSVFDESNPGAEGTALISFSGNAYAAANNGYARAHLVFQGWDSGGPWYQPWSGEGSGFNGHWFFSDTNVQVGSGTSSKETGVESVNYSVNWRVRYNQNYRINFHAHATTWSNETPNLDYSSRAYIDPVIGLPDGAGITIATLGDNPIFPTIVLPSDEYPQGEFQSVPIPGAVWLFGSGLIGLVGFRKKFNK